LLFLSAGQIVGVKVGIPSNAELAITANTYLRHVHLLKEYVGNFLIKELGRINQ